MQYNPAWQTRLICELSTLCHLLIMIHQSIFQIMAAMTTAATLAAVGAGRRGGVQIKVCKQRRGGGGGPREKW
ncbi:hypothetical protein CEE61_04155 [Stenotrophomonas maltophilia]|nr:hypothetical protein CEE61_04155 [Stenotrophomonas maltophilia]